jgi:hypothetical protein
MNMNLTIELDLDTHEATFEERVIEAAAKRCLRDTGIEERVDKLVTAMVSEKVQEAVTKRIEDAVADGADSVVQPTNEYGRHKGEPTTVKEILFSKAESYLQEKTDRHGKSDRHGSFRRIDYLIGEIADRAWNTKIAKQVNDEMARIEKALHAKAIAEFSAKLQKLTA